MYSLKSILTLIFLWAFSWVFLLSETLAETTFTNEAIFEATVGEPVTTLDFDELIDSNTSNRYEILKSKQAVHPTNKYLQLVESIGSRDIIYIYGYAFSNAYSFASAVGENQNVRPVIKWNSDNTISILDEYNYLKITSADSNPIGLKLSDGSFYGISPGAGETSFFISSPGRISSIEYGHTNPIGISTWQGEGATWQGEAVQWQ